MTAAARRVLADCELAVAELAPTVDPALWRRRWIAALALLRVVGHVLHKVDGQADGTIQKAVDDWWREISANRAAHPIFWSFIDEERNSILKEYRSRGVHLERTTVRFSISTGSQLEQATTYATVLEGGPFDGRHQVDLGREAVAWWREQLDAIDLRCRSAA